MAYVLDGVIGTSLGSTSAGTSTDGVGALFTLGQTVKATDGGLYMYVQAEAAITQYDCVTIDENFQAQPVTTTLATEVSGDAGNFYGFAQVAFADNDFGWVALKGSNIRCRVVADTTADVMLYTSATAGVLTSVSAGVLLNGLVTVTTTSVATNIEVIASNPISRLAAGLAA